MYTTNQILFPPTLIAKLRDGRGPAWASLIDHVVQLPQAHEESLALVLTMVKLDGCLICETDSYRAMRGCEACALQNLRRAKLTDDELMTMYATALTEVRTHLGKTQRATVGVLRR